MTNSKCYFAIRLLLRIKCDDPQTSVPLGDKFGVSVKESYKLLMLAKNLNLEVIGVS